MYFITEYCYALLYDINENSLPIECCGNIYLGQLLRILYLLQQIMEFVVLVYLLKCGVYVFALLIQTHVL